MYTYKKHKKYQLKLKVPPLCRFWSRFASNMSPNRVKTTKQAPGSGSPAYLQRVRSRTKLGLTAAGGGSSRWRFSPEQVGAEAAPKSSASLQFPTWAWAPLQLLCAAEPKIIGRTKRIHPRFPQPTAAAAKISRGAKRTPCRPRIDAAFSEPRESWVFYLLFLKRLLYLL